MRDLQHFRRCAMLPRRKNRENPLSMPVDQTRKRDDVLAEVFRRTRGQNQLAMKLKLSRVAVNRWRRIPVKHVLVIARLTGIAPSTLRPDVYKRGMR